MLHVHILKVPIVMLTSRGGHYLCSLYYMIPVTANNCKILIAPSLIFGTLMNYSDCCFFCNLVAIRRRDPGIKTAVHKCQYRRYIKV